MRSKRTQLAFGKAVRKFRIARGFSQEKLAEIAEIHRTYLGDVERGERNISIVNMSRIATALNISLTDLTREMERYLEK